jgi:hypothetical protein
MRTLLLPALAASLAAAAPTYHKDVAPILQSRCQSCHRAGEIGPMPLENYRQARPWAKAIKEAALTRKMPPWFASPAHGKFSNDRSLSAADVRTLADWADAGAPEGNPADAPPPRVFVSGWNLPREPDLVVEMPQAFTVPPSGRIEYTYIVMPLNLTEDRWVQMAEARPGSGKVVHHITVYVRDPESKWLRGEAEPGVPFTAPKRYPDGRPRTDLGGMGNEILLFYVPGYDPTVFPAGQAKKIRAGSDIVIEMHYTPNGTETADRSRVGLVYAREPVRERVIIASTANRGFTIPPGAPEHRVEAMLPFRNYGTILSVYPHMHLRGKAFEMRLVDAGGRSETILRVDRYNFNWQLEYKLAKPIPIEPGMRLECTAWFDNSPNNPMNPDPTAEVRWGEMSWEEMMAAAVMVAVDASLTPREWMSGRRPPPAE